MDLLYGFILGTHMAARPPRNPLGMFIGITIIAAVVVVATLLCRKMGQEKISDTSKTLWGLSFYLLPVISWLAYYFTVTKGISISKTTK